MSAPRPVSPDDATIIGTVQASRAAAAAGRTAEAEQLLVQVARAAPNHPAVLNELGVVMMSRGSAEQAFAMFDRATKVEPGRAALWSNLASALKALNRRQEEREALEKALSLEPRHVSSLLQKAALLEEMADPRNAARLYQQALANIPPGTAPAPSIRELVEHARQVIQADQVALSVELEARLSEIRARHGGEAQHRVERCLEMSTGRRTAHFPRPTFMYFPEIPAIEYFEREYFPWLAQLEAATDDIRNELTNVLIADREGLQAYIDFPQGLPIEQWKDLNHSRRWSAYFLWNQGTAVASHVARCPKTAAALAAIPRCDVPGRAPTAFFSILDANTTIPPHTGVTNTRLTVHLPLIVPPKCRFRVGSTTREWQEGQAWVFDDTIEHEAWNDSDTARAVLIFDIWNPFLKEVERDMVRAATEVITTYYQLPPEGQL